MSAPEAPPSRTPVADALPETPYPRYFQAIVGVAPDKMKFFTVDDMRVLVEVYKAVTGVNPLQATRPLADICRDIANEVTPWK